MKAELTDRRYTIPAMRRWSELADRVAGTSATSGKTALLAEYLAPLPPPELRIAATFLTGRPFAEVDQRPLGLGWATIAAAVGHLAGVEPAALAEAYDRHSDLGRAVADVLALRARQPDPADTPSLREVSDAFAAIGAAGGPAAKGAIFADLLARCDPPTAMYAVKILTGELRIGLREGLLEAAIARAFGQPQAEVSLAGMLTGDVGETAVLASEGRLAEARLRLLHPIRFMLASPAESASAILGRLGARVWVEDKYDGIRAQLHRRGTEVRLFSRDLNDVSEQFPEIVHAAADLPWDGVLDGEVLAFSEGTVLPFQALQSRLGRKSPSERIQAAVPVIYVAFDALALGPRSESAGAPGSVAPLLAVPLAERRRRLEALGLPLAGDGGRFALSHLVSVESAEALDRVFEEARARHNEGLMVKDPGSGYSPGRRGMGWLKMKRALATLDCVVVGVEVGHGKRHGVLSDYTFAVRDEAADRLVTIGKAYTGLTDAEIAEMTRWFEEHAIRRFGRYLQVEPTVVVEVAFDVIMRSKRHQSGFALRFPRIVRLRPNKPASEIDTLANVERLYSELGQGARFLVADSGSGDGAVASAQRSTGRSRRSPHSAQPPS